MLKPGDILDHYIVEALVGGGGMARVYRVRHRILDQPMALKVLEPEFVGRERVRKRFLSEGRIMAQVRHPAIVMVTDAVIDPVRGVAGLVMEYVEGPDLERVIARMKGPPAARFVRRIFLPVLDGVHHVHHEGVVHRDLKPANVLLSRDAAGHWYPRVTDFGVAWMGAAASLRAGRPPTKDGGIIGTPAYMSPEQARGEGKPKAQWDVWALGVMLYELATGGHHPFDQGEEEDTLAAVRAGACTPPEEIHPGIDPRIAAAIRGALQPDLAERLPSALAMVDLLSEDDAPALTGPIQVPGHEVRDAPGAWLETADGRTRLTLGSPFVLGSGARVDLHVPGDGVEPEHCRIEHVDGRWVVEDLSVGGTRVNGARNPRVQLADGDQLRLGNSAWRLRIGDVPKRAEPSVDSLPTFGTPTPKPSQVASGPCLVLADGRRVPIGLAPLVLGRSPAVDVVLQDPTVSVRHARVSVQGHDVLVEDLLSQNGTWVNGQKVRFRRLTHGDRLRVGDTEVDVELRRSQGAVG